MGTIIESTFFIVTPYLSRVSNSIPYRATVSRESIMNALLNTWIYHTYLLCLLYLNDMLILPKYNSSNSDVVSSNAPPPMSAEVVLLGDFC